MFVLWKGGMSTSLQRCSAHCHNSQSSSNTYFRPQSPDCSPSLSSPLNRTSSSYNSSTATMEQALISTSCGLPKGISRSESMSFCATRCTAKCPLAAVFAVLDNPQTLSADRCHGSSRGAADLAGA